MVVTFSIYTYLSDWIGNWLSKELFIFSLLLFACSLFTRFCFDGVYFFLSGLTVHTIQYQIRLFMLIYWRVLAQIYQFHSEGVSNRWCPWNGSFFSVLCSARIINVKRKHWLYDIGRWCRHRERHPCKRTNTKHWNLCVLLIIQHNHNYTANCTLFISSIWMRRRQRRWKKKEKNIRNENDKMRI